MNNYLLKSISLLWHMLSSNIKESFILLYFLVLIASVAEFLIVISMAPLLSQVTSSSPGGGLEKMHLLFIEYFNGFYINISKDEFFLLYCTLVAILFFSASILRLIIAVYQAKLTYKASAEISKEIFSGSLKNSLNSVLKFGEARLTSTVTIKITEIFNQVFLPFFQLLTSVIITSAVVATLYFYNAEVTIASAALIMLFYYVTTSLTKSIVYDNGVLINKKSNELMGLVSSSYSSARIITIWQLTDFISSKFDVADRAIRKAKAVNSIFSLGPRYVLEGVSFAAIFILMGVFYQSTGESIIPVIGTFVVAAQRIMPLSQIIYSSLNSMRGTQGFVSDLHDLHDEFKSNNTPVEKSYKESKVSYDSSLTISWKNFSAHNLSRDGTKQTTKISMDGHAGDMIVLVGKSGVGKSTLMESMMGIRPNFSGNCCLMGECFQSVTNEQGQSVLPNDYIGYMPQVTSVFQGTLLENILLGESIDSKKLDLALNISGLFERLQWLENGINVKLGSDHYELSGGERQMLGIARILYRNSKVIFVDEPTSGLDSEAAMSLMKKLKKVFSNSVLIVITHDEKVVDLADKVVKIES
jgi:ATP-binding cassette, subfamily B, bacterial PglK